MSVKIGRNVKYYNVLVACAVMGYQPGSTTLGYEESIASPRWRPIFEDCQPLTRKNSNLLLFGTSLTALCCLTHPGRHVPPKILLLFLNSSLQNNNLTVSTKFP